MPDKAQEQFCIRKLKKYLLSRSANSEVRWKSEKNDPPDFWLWQDGMKYAVEVTSILDKDTREFNISLWGLIKDAETNAKEQKILVGRYIVDIQAPLAKGERSERTELKAIILDYVKRTADEPRPAHEPISIGGRVVCHISKYHGEGAGIFPIGGTGRGKGESDVRQDLTARLKEAITGKAQDLARFACPKILVLYDWFRWDEDEMFAECVRTVPESTLFRLVHVVKAPWHRLSSW
jgi:hypothetical protein